MSTNTAIKERPILMCADMVLATLADRKTQTRRTIKPQPINPPFSGRYEAGYAWWELNERGNFHRADKPCPYGQPGDRLWVRESFSPICDFDPWGDMGCDYRADYKGDQTKVKWTPSIHMPRCASRLTLEITDIRVERLNDISGADARAESLEPDWDAFNDATDGYEGWDEPEEFIEECEEQCDYINFGHNLVHSSEHQEWLRDRENYALRLAFKNLWQSINGKDSWEQNPWVWVVGFKRV
jgi:hypothetical protein